MRTVAIAVIAGMLVVPCCVGCGSASGKSGAATAPVKGTVTYLGKPLKGGMITFEPDGPGREAFGDIKPDGTFELMTYKPGDGAVIGTHRVAIKNAGKSIPAKYGSLASAQLEVEVKEGKTDYTIDLK